MKKEVKSFIDDAVYMGRRMGQAAKLMVGLPDYEQYLNHMEKNHPDQAHLSYAEFFKDRQEARYGGGNGKMGRCC